MEQNRPKQTDQQATNAALAALAAAGNTFALGQLWEVNKGFVRRQLWQWYHHRRCKQCLCMYKAPCLARTCWAASQTL